MENSLTVKGTYAAMYVWSLLLIAHTARCSTRPLNRRYTLTSRSYRLQNGYGNSKRCAVPGDRKGCQKVELDAVVLEQQYSTVTYREYGTVSDSTTSLLSLTSLQNGSTFCSKIPAFFLSSTPKPSNTELHTHEISLSRRAEPLYTPPCARTLCPLLELGEQVQVLLFMDNDIFELGTLPKTIVK